VFYNQAFEWRFEFPEVLDAGGRFTGFDVVIGNPPYIRQEQLGDMKDYFKTHFNVYQGTADLYSYFIEQGMNLLRQNGLFHYIVSNKWMRANYGKPLREWMQQYQIESIIDFGDLPVFEEATTYPCLLQLRREEFYKSFKAVEVENLDFEILPQYISKNKIKVDQSKLQIEGWALIEKKAQDLIEKLKCNGLQLKEFCNGKIFYGIKTGLNKAFVIDKKMRDHIIKSDNPSSKFIKPFLAGKDIKRYEPPAENKYLIYIPNGWSNNNLHGDGNKWKLFQEEYPALAKYLEQFKEKAQKRYDQGEFWWELRPCSYLNEFKKPKIILPDIARKGNFTFDEDGKYYLVNTAYFIGKNDKYLLGVLASSLIDFFYRCISASYRGGYLRFIYQYLEVIPIVEPDKSNREEIESLVEKILSIKKSEPEADISNLDSKIDKLVYELYGLNEDEIAIIEESIGK